MSSVSPPAQPVDGLEARRAAAAWQGAWALAVTAAAALVLLVLSDPPARALLALGLGAVPGLLGMVWRPKRVAGRRWLLGAWAAGPGLAVALSGGLTGPLAAWAAAPLLASVVLGGLWVEGAALAFLVVAAVAVVQAGGRLAPPVGGSTGLALAIAALAVGVGGAAGALMLALGGRDGAEPSASAGAELQARLEAAQRARADAEADARGKMRFLANVSHELRTPLNAIMGFSDIMRARLFGELSPRYAEYAELIHESGGHLLDLINDVLDVSKIDADRYVLAREAFDAREAATAALRILRQQADDAGVQLRGVLPPAPLEVDADRRALKQIVLNLCSNALKFTPVGGSVTVSFAAVDEALEIAVTDTGVGVAPEDLARLGRPYEQAGDAADRVRGTGLGLALVKALARLHGGDMAIESRLGEGTAVTVRMPVMVREPVEAASG